MNENPFLKDTPVTIFTQGSEANDWFRRNCGKCVHKVDCELYKAMLNSDGFYCTVPLHIAKRIGINYNPLYLQGTPHSRCSEFDNGNNPF